MLSLFRRRMGIPGLISVFALVFAMTGGAYAALTGPEKAEMKKLAKKYAKKFAKAGPPGPGGPQGPAGPVGPVGPAGAAGAAGAKGATGPTGAAGAAGAKGATGDKGSTGATGPTGTFVPGSLTLTGTYNAPKLNTEFGEFTGLLKDGEHYVEPLSFIIPRTAAIPDTSATYVPASGANYGTNVAKGCPGVTGEVPKADVGKFCVYEAPTPTVPFGDATVTISKSAPGDATEAKGIGPAGGSLWVECDTPPEAFPALCSAAGLWAVGPSS